MRDGVYQAKVDAGVREVPTSSERVELAASRRQNRQLLEDVGILKRATASARERGDQRVNAGRVRHFDNSARGEP
ncbi:hypothetical protein GCM10023194_25760 [Planotetraspora phitsanulokensis]|uniref:Transposase n=1 Tax=Planotetraspora phitsanulokensis TaxID=575192 RepID=A0A8J3UAR8_9ACTN|nr:hypothetical protein Pph01_69260 [Planotetraspora phitsanulokensis]